MSSPAQRRKRNTPDGVQPNPVRTGPIKRAAISSPMKTTNSQRPNPIREAEGKAAHLFHDASTQHMPTPTYSNNQDRHAGSCAPKPVRASATKAATISSPMMNNALGRTIITDSHLYELPYVLLMFRQSTTSAVLEQQPARVGLSLTKVVPPRAGATKGKTMASGKTMNASQGPKLVRRVAK